ncbi:alpha/beta hydrolase domain protein [Xylariaceae sp. FL0255]|nr:alpha/beta hydrolase domain protein [Xylariaceae sp. FL0255]
MTFTTRPPYDPELSTVLNELQDIIPSKLTFTNLPKFQEQLDKFRMLLSNRFIASDTIVVNVEYRVAPAYPAPKAVDDCYTAISWIYTSADSSRFSIDKARILIARCNAGGGLAAGVSLMVRDHTLADARAYIVGLVLISPMLDNRVNKELAKQAVLKHQYSNENISSWVVPRRAQDISGLPRIYLDISSVDLFREHNLALHVWPGAFHEFDTLAPSAALSLKSTTAKTNWVRDVLALK